MSAPAIIPPPRRRHTVGAGVLLAVVIGAFAWGLAMYAAGAAARPPGPPRDPAEAALSQLTRIDQALGADDAATARAELAQLPASGDPVWAAARLQRERSATAVAQRVAARDLAQERARLLAQRLQRLGGEGADLLDLAPAPGGGQALLALAYGGARGMELRASRDGGAQWAPPAEVRGSAPRLVHHALAPQLLVLALGEGGALLAWSSRDGIAFAPVKPPEHAGAGDLARPWAVGGDGTLVAALAAPGGERCLRSADGGASWQAGPAYAELLLLAPTAAGILVVARTAGDEVQLSSDGGATYHAGERELAALLAREGAPRLYAVAGGVVVAGQGAARRLDASGRLLGAGFALPGGSAPAALIAHPRQGQRWYALGDHALWRSDDGGGHWRRAAGRLGEIGGRCLEFAPGDRPRLLIGGDQLWRLDDEDEPLLFDEPPVR